MIELVLGGARSGKSAYAENIAIKTGLSLYYIATATPGDAEMAARILHHQLQRKGAWVTVEEPIRLASVLQQYAAEDRCILVDCLTLWLSNALLDGEPDCWSNEKNRLLDTLIQLPGQIIMVSNEVGQGIVPLGEINRRFVDEAGRLHQEIAAMADKVVFITAGLVQILKEEKSL